MLKITPEPGEVVTLLVLTRVGNHDGSLGSPEETCTDTEEDTGEEREAIVGAVNGAEQAASVDGITNTTKGEAGSDTEPVDEGTTEETEDGEGAVESSVLKNLGSAHHH